MSFRRRTLSLLLVATTIAVGAAVGCGGHSASKSDDNGRAAGHWQLTGATTFASYEGITFLDLSKDGSGLLLSKEPVLGAVGCGHLVFAVLNDKVLSIEFPGGSVTYYQYKRSGSTLTLTDAFGGVTTFSSVPSIPANETCTALPAATPIYFPADSHPYLGYGGTIAGDGTRIWFGRYAQNDASWFDVANMTTGGSYLSATQFHWAETAQNGTLWTECNCGSGIDVERLDTAGNLIDTLTFTDVGIGLDFSQNAISFDGTDLWATGGMNTGTQAPMWLKIDSGADPNLLLSSGLLPTYSDGMIARNGHLLVLQRLVGSTLVEIDPSNGTVVKSYLMPPGRQYWQTLTVANGTVYSQSADDYNNPVLYPLIGL